MSLKNSNNGTEVQQGTESLDTQSNAENTNSTNYSEKLFEQHDCKEIPFMAIIEDNQNDMKKWYGVIGQSKVTHDYQSKEELEEALNNIGIKDWVQTCAIVAGFLELTAIKHFENVEKGENK